MLKLEGDDWLRIDAGAITVKGHTGKVNALSSAAKLAMGQKIQVVAEGEHLYIRFRHQLSDEVMAALVHKFALTPKVDAPVPIHLQGRQPAPTPLRIRTTARAIAKAPATLPSALARMSRRGKDPRQLGLEIERTLDSLKATGDGEWTLIDLTQPLTVAQCAGIMGMTVDELKSVIWARNFPLAAVGGWADEMRISPQVLVKELEARKRGARRCGLSGKDALGVECP